MGQRPWPRAGGRPGGGPPATARRWRPPNRWNPAVRASQGSTHSRTITEADRAGSPCPRRPRRSPITPTPPITAARARWVLAGRVPRSRDRDGDGDGSYPAGQAQSLEQPEDRAADDGDVGAADRGQVGESAELHLTSRDSGSRRCPRVPARGATRRRRRATRRRAGGDRRAAALPIASSWPGPGRSGGDWQRPAGRSNGSPRRRRPTTRRL